MKKLDNSKQYFGLAESYQDFSQLLKSVRKNAKISAAKMADATGVHANSQNFYENKQRDPSIDYLIAYSCTIGVSFWQLLTRRIELGGASSAHKKQILDEITPFYQHVIDQHERNKTQLTAQQSPVESTSSNTPELVAACYQLLDKHQDNSSVKIILQSGQSMSPTINDGDTLFVDTTQQQLTEGELYVIELGQSHGVKRIQYLPDGGIMLIADNAQYHAINIAKEDMNNLNVIGKLISSISHYG